jgi:hypothetical protein
MQTKLFHIVFPILSMLICLSLYSQEIKKYQGPYSFHKGDTGVAQYSYWMDDDGREVREGEFTFSEDITTSSGNTTRIIKEDVKGQYLKGYKSGDWTYIKSYSKVKINGVKQGKLDYSLDHLDFKLEGSYVKGLHDGPWVYERKSPENFNGEVMPESVTMTFSKGVINGDFYAKINALGGPVEVKGRVTNSLMDGMWSLIDSSREEYRHYQHGILYRMVLVKSSDTLSNLEFPLSQKVSKALESYNYKRLVNRPVRLLFRDGYPESSEYVRMQQHGNRILSEILINVFQYDKEGFGRAGLPMGTNRGSYPLSKDELADLQTWYEEYDLYEEVIKTMEKEEILDLTYSTEPSIAFIVSWLEMQDDKIWDVENWMNHIIVDKIERTYRNGLLTDSAKILLGKDEMLVLNKLQSIEYAPQAKEEQNLLKYLAANITSRRIVADSLLREFRVKVKSLQVSKEVLERQQSIITLKEELDSTLKENFGDPSMSRLAKKVHDVYLDDIVEGEYHQFLSEINNKEHQAILGDSIMLELHSIENIYEMLHHINQRRRYIDTLYTEYVFDPFTYTDQVPQRIKKKLYDEVAVKIFNQMVDLALEAKTPFECEETLDNLYEIQAELIYLKNRDTHRLERKLRKAKSLEERLNLLDEARDD